MAPKTIIVRQYKGYERRVRKKFEKDARKLDAQGYDITSQEWIPGSHGCASILTLGLLNLILPKPGTLNVTYKLRPPSP